MSEKPILFNSNAVRAILAGRKTQTRRVIQERRSTLTGLVYAMRNFPAGYYEGIVDGLHQFYQPRDGIVHRRNCPYAVGDRLWARETWKPSLSEYHETGQGHGSPDDPCYGYKATMTYTCGASIPDYPITWKSPIIMPKLAARIWLDVAGIRAERLQDISEDDIKAEGVLPDMVDSGALDPNMGTGIDIADWHPPFIRLWDTLNAKRGYLWTDNPWVWVVEFTVKGGA